MLGKFTWQQQTNGGLDLPAGDGGTLVVVRQARRLGSDPLEDVVDKAVHDGHGFAGDAGVRMHLLQDFIDVNAETFLPPALFLLLVGRADGFLGLAGLLDGFSARLGWHFFSCLHSALPVRTTGKHGTARNWPFFIPSDGFCESVVSNGNAVLNYVFRCNT